MNRLSIQFNTISEKYYQIYLLFEKKIDIELTVSIRCLTMNRRRLHLSEGVDLLFRNVGNVKYLLYLGKLAIVEI